MKREIRIINFEKQFTPDGLDNDLIKKEICKLIDKPAWGGNFQITVSPFYVNEENDGFEAKITIDYME